jgi:hypothetical protein
MNKLVIITWLLILTTALGYSPSFNSGELTPKLRYRVDLDKKYLGVETLENFLVKPQGAAMRRPGTFYVAEAKGEAHLISFEAGENDSYPLEFTDGFIRFYRDE